jgi:hypothetical protein
VARYYFDIDDGEHSITDDEGTEADSLQIVRNEAISVLPDIAREELPDGDYRVFAIQVRDEMKRPIFKATLTLRAEWLPAAPTSADLIHKAH